MLWDFLYLPDEPHSGEMASHSGFYLLLLSDSFEMRLAGKGFHKPLISTRRPAGESNDSLQISGTLCAPSINDRVASLQQKYFL